MIIKELSFFVLFYISVIMRKIENVFKYSMATKFLYAVFLYSLLLFFWDFDSFAFICILAILTYILTYIRDSTIYLRYKLHAFSFSLWFGFWFFFYCFKTCFWLNLLTFYNFWHNFFYVLTKVRNALKLLSLWSYLPSIPFIFLTGRYLFFISSTDVRCEWI